MSADESAFARLYEHTAHLAYDETQMAINPLLPFSESNVPALTAQAQQVLDAANRLHSLNPSAVDQSRVVSAEQVVQNALTKFKVINTQPTNSYTTQEVFNAVHDAVNKINAV